MDHEEQLESATGERAIANLHCAITLETAAVANTPTEDIRDVAVVHPSRGGESSVLDRANLGALNTRDGLKEGRAAIGKHIALY